jgi:beta-lactamase class A
MKVPVMIELVRESETGALRLDQRVLLVNQFGSIVDGSPYSLDPKEDSDSAMYARVGERVTVRELMDRMITRSSNLATNAVIALVGARRVDSVAHTLGATRMRVLRGVEDGKAYERGLNNTTTAADLAALLSAIANGRAASPAGTAVMLDVLSRQEFNGEIPAGLPAGTRVAHKTGQITAVLHDAAIVYPAGRPPYVLVVLTRGVPDEAVARALIADVSRLVYEHAVGGGGAAGGRCSDAGRPPRRTVRRAGRRGRLHTGTAGITRGGAGLRIAVPRAGTRPRPDGGARDQRDEGAQQPTAGGDPVSARSERSEPRSRERKVPQ